MLFTSLLFIHLASVAIWLGGAVYERFVLVRKIKKAVGTQLELELTEMFFSSARLFLPAVLLLLLSGIAMTIQAGYSFFGGDWLGIKQSVMAVIILLFNLYIGPRNKKLAALVEQDRSNGGTLSDSARQAFNRAYIGFDIIHAGVILNMILAVWKPF
ncbi:MAG: DUF2269 family protein [Paenibacillaceae bacterium]|nr:DUF2269 family protein [Paenibacillaceae bacterium]